MTLIKKEENIPQKKSPTESEIRDAVSWCQNNGIKIYFEPTARDTRFGHLILDDNGYVSKSIEIYKQEKLFKKDPRWWDVVNQMYYQIKIKKDGNKTN